MHRDVRLLRGNEFGFCGYAFDSEILSYTVRFRHYDPSQGMGRWLERDPAGYVDSMGLYAYVGDRPIGLVDPFGLMEWWEKGIEASANFFAGWGDVLSGGYTRKIREERGWDDQTNCSSSLYTLGQTAGIVHEVAIGAAGTVAVSGTSLTATVSGGALVLTAEGATVLEGAVGAVAVTYAVVGSGKVAYDAAFSEGQGPHYYPGQGWFDSW